MAASASIPPTPQPNTPMPLTIGVWLSVPINMSGTAQTASSIKAVVAIVANCSKLIVCMMPVPGGYMLRPFMVLPAHFIKRYRSELWMNSAFIFLEAASDWP